MMFILRHLILLLAVGMFPGMNTFVSTTLLREDNLVFLVVIRLSEEFVFTSFSKLPVNRFIVSRFRRRVPRRLCRLLHDNTVCIEIVSLRNTYRIRVNE